MGSFLAGFLVYEEVGFSIDILKIELYYTPDSKTLVEKDLRYYPYMRTAKTSNPI